MKTTTTKAKPTSKKKPLIAPSLTERRALRAVVLTLDRVADDLDNRLTEALERLRDATAHGSWERDSLTTYLARIEADRSSTGPGNALDALMAIVTEADEQDVRLQKALQ